MNERIRELLNEAGRYAYEQNPGENSYGRPVDENKYNQDRDTKFAELIIQECLDQLHVSNWDEDYDKGIYWSREQIKNHFGVEE